MLIRNKYNQEKNVNLIKINKPKSMIYNYNFYLNDNCGEIQ